MSGTAPGERPATGRAMARPLAPAAPGQAASAPAARPADPLRAAEDAGALRHEPIALVDLLDRVLAGGVVITGDVKLSISGVDLVTISLQALISSISAITGEDNLAKVPGRPGYPGPDGPGSAGP